MIIIALDYDDINQARALVAQLDPKQCRLKIATAMYTRYGAAWVQELQDLGFEIFLDLKFHDIPKQVAGAVKSALDLGVWMVDIHASGGPAMIEAAANIIAASQSDKKPLLIAVTMLTSLDESDREALGYAQPIPDLVTRMAELAMQHGADGVVSSPQEVSLLRQQLGEQAALVTPGIRLADNTQDDQKRTLTPQAACDAGASYLVIGRAITQAKNPVEVLGQLHGDLCPQ